ncbi:MAG: purine/pyrimidine permease [Alistipes sp.]|nr:purine/pyrimidine permease [Alistipes sp.]
MNLKYNVDDRLPAGQLAVYALQWFVLCIAVVSTSVFVATGSPEDRLFFSQRLFAVMGVAGFVQVVWGHRLPLVVGPAAVLLVGVMASLNAKADTSSIYSSIAIGGVFIALLTLGGVMRHVQRIFTPRIVVVILMLIATTLAPTITGLVFPAHASHNEHIFGLLFAVVGSVLMVIFNRRLRGVAKSLVIPLALVVGSALYYALFDAPHRVASAASLRGMLLDEFSLDWSLVVAFVICYIALAINDIGSMESLGGMLGIKDMDVRAKRGMRLTGVMNIVAGAMGVLGPVNYSMSPGVIASTGCASRYALIPATLMLLVCSLFPDVIWVLTAIPSPVIGVILLFLMGTQLAASYEMMQSTRSATTFADALTIGLPIMVAMLFQLMPKGIAPEVIQPLVGNGFAMGVVMVILMEHVINRPQSR